MPTYKAGNMWRMDPEPDVWFVTGNSTLRKDGKLVMGAGAALQARRIFPGCDEYFGKVVAETCGSGGVYGILVHPEYKLGLFQTKRHWKESASLTLVYNSAVHLLEFLSRHNDHVVSLNFPGIGKGGLDKTSVIRHATRHLPDNVVIWQWKREYES